MVHLVRPEQGTDNALLCRACDELRDPVVPQEWFLLPLFVIDEAVARIKNGTISGPIYDPESARLIRQPNQ